MSRTLWLITLIGSACTPKPEFQAGRVMETGVKAFALAEAGPDAMRICYTFLDDSAACAPMPRSFRYQDDYLDPLPPTDINMAGPVRDLVVDAHGSCFIRGDSGVSCEPGRPVDDPVAWEGVRTIVDLEASDGRVCALTADHAVVCSSGPAPETGGAPVRRLRSLSSDGVCAILMDGSIGCESPNRAFYEDEWLQGWLSRLDAFPVVDLAEFGSCALGLNQRPVCSGRTDLEGIYDEIWRPGWGVATFTNPRQALHVPLLPDEPTYDMGPWEDIDMGIVHADRGTPTYIEGRYPVDCGLVGDTVYCW